MRKVTATYQPPHAMSPEELAACRRHLERQWETQRVDAALLQRAWDTAYQVAAMLYQDFGATRVAVFGSLAEPEWFTSQSDIDIVAWGISRDAYWDAYGKVIYFEPAFKIDFVTFEETKGLFRERVQSQAVFIENHAGGTPKQPAAAYCPPISAERGGRYEMNRSRLIQRIADERVKIEGTIARIHRGLVRIELTAAEDREFIEGNIATSLAEGYEGMEKIFKRIAREVDTHVPSGAEWHKRLLAQMAARRVARPPVLSQETTALLRELLEFRHKVRNIYGDELIYAITEAHAKQIPQLFARVCADLDTFADSLEKEESSK